MTRSPLRADPPLLVTSVPGRRSREIAARLRDAECPAFDARRDARSETSGVDHGSIVYERGEGANVYDVDGNRYVDLACGFGAETFGHAPKFLTEARAEAVRTLPLALGDVYASEHKVVLLERLRALHSPRARVMLGLSGADAVTAALKTAALSVGPRVLAFHGSYHGLSHGPLAACGLSPNFRDPFRAQLGAHVTFADYPNDARSLPTVLAEVDLWLEEGPGAILVEPVLGRGGCIVPPPDFLPSLLRACERNASLLIADEIWTGMGRSGALSLSRHQGLSPDLITLGKGLGGGAPISACIGGERAMNAWAKHGGATIHTGTHFGNPDGCAAALAVLDRLDDALLRDVRTKGERWREDLEAIRQRASDAVREVRGLGLMVGVELADARIALRVTMRLLERGYIVLTGGIHWNVLTLTPPLEVSEGALISFDRSLADILRSETQ